MLASTLLALAAVSGSALLGGSSPVQAATGTTTVFIVPSGYGDIIVDKGLPAPYHCDNALYAGIGCSVSVPTGTTLTFRAVPAQVQAPEPVDPAPKPPVASDFRGWSRPECGSSGSCTVKTAADEEWVVAQFSPVWLEAVVAGSGTIDAGGVTRKCADDRCVVGLFSAGTPVTVTARPATAGAAAKWGFGCDPYASDLSNGRCVVQMSNVRNFVSIGFGGAEPDPSPPFNQAINFRVERAGGGQGQVQGSGPSADLEADPWKIDCGSVCGVPGLQYQTQVRLRAVKGADSEFERWLGPPCLTDDTCTFTVGKYPKVVAVFRKTSSGTQPFNVVVASVAATGRRATRTVVVRLTSSHIARVNLRLLRTGRTLGRMTVDVKVGATRLTVPVSTSAKPGWVAVDISVRNGAGTTLTFRKWLRLGT